MRSGGLNVERAASPGLASCIHARRRDTNVMYGGTCFDAFCAARSNVLQWYQLQEADKQHVSRVTTAIACCI